MCVPTAVPIEENRIGQQLIPVIVLYKGAVCVVAAITWPSGFGFNDRELEIAHFVLNSSLLQCYCYELLLLYDTCPDTHGGVRQGETFYPHGHGWGQLSA